MSLFSLSTDSKLFSNTVRTFYYYAYTRTTSLLVNRDYLARSFSRRILARSFSHRSWAANALCAVSELRSSRWTWTATGTRTWWWARARTTWAYSTRGRTSRSMNRTWASSVPRVRASRGPRCLMARSTTRLKARFDRPLVARSAWASLRKTRKAARPTSSAHSALHINSVSNGATFGLQSMLHDFNTVVKLIKFHTSLSSTKWRKTSYRFAQTSKFCNFFQVFTSTIHSEPQ